MAMNGLPSGWIGVSVLEIVSISEDMGVLLAPSAATGCFGRAGAPVCHGKGAM